jgi:deoxyuridine 5'-triphosphate nucleotidohydrolase
MTKKSENNVICKFCGKEFHLKPSRIKKAKYNYCSVECSGKHKVTRYSGKNNPNRIYDYDDGFLDNIDTEFKAWFLGWILSDGGISKNGSIVLSIHPKDIDVLKTIKQYFNNSKEIDSVKNRNIVKYTISSKKFIERIKHYSGINDKNCFKISENMKTIRDIPDSMVMHFIRGYFEGDGSIRNINFNKRQPECKITSLSLPVLEWIQSKIGIKSIIITSNRDGRKLYDLMWYGINSLDFLAKIYDGSSYRMVRKYASYLDIVNWQPRIAGSQYCIDGIKIGRTTRDAIIPTKAHGSDSGYDLTIISKVKEFGRMELFDTGICVEPPHGFYFDVVPRSSITKTGYIMANSVGVIDRGYIGTIKIGLLKIDKEMPDLVLPCKIAQMILRPAFHFDIEEVETFSETERGSGGFGSSGK